MASLRVVLSDHVLVEDASTVLRSIDELARIVTWIDTSEHPTRPLYRVVRRDATWRSVDGLRISRVQTGSQIFDIGSSLIDNGIILAVLFIATRVLLNRDHRLAMNQLKEESERMALRHREENQQLAVAKESLALVREARELSVSELPGAQSGRMPAEIEETVSRFLIERRPLDVGQDDRYRIKTLNAYTDAWRAVRRLWQVQRRRAPVEDIREIEE